MLSRVSHSQQKFFFLMGVAAIYVALFVGLDYLQGPPYWDERTFWKTSLTFSDRLIPSLDDLRNYRELNTPLPFVVFGALEYLFNQGMFAGRLLNFCLSLVMVAIVGWPDRKRGSRALLCLLGLFACPYYLFLSGRLYTEMIACFWLLLGLVGYAHNRYLPSIVGFVLAIASRQYMLAFPAAIVAHEFLTAIRKAWRDRRFAWADHWRWLAPALAAASILGWFVLFGGLAPAAGIEHRAPTVQRTLWALNPGIAINFLAFVGLYIVIPEFVLFRPSVEAITTYLQKQRREIALLVVALVLAIAIFPPAIEGRGPSINIVERLPDETMALFCIASLALLALLRFARPGLMLWFLVANCAIMTKAVPWDRYVLPMVVAFWYLKSLEESDEAPPSGDSTGSATEVAETLSS